MLGEPPKTNYFSDWDVVYWLGPERGLAGIDSEWLIVRIGEDGRVAERGWSPIEWIALRGSATLRA